MTIALLLIPATLFLAYANGANDNFKGVATLSGCGATDYRHALAWATITTLAGSLLATLLASGLITTFSGKGLVADAVAGDPAFMIAVGIGAASTVLIATLTGLPISTTHALLGALVGVGLIATGGQIGWAKLGGTFFLPLLLSPLLAIALALVAYPPLRRIRRRLGVSSETCVCLESGEFVPAAAGADGVLEVHRSGLPVLRVDDAARCVARYQGRVLGVSAAAIADWVHYLSAGSVSFARGLNDTPKIVAILITGQALAPRFGFALVGLFIAVGGLLSARRVARTMSEKITDMNVGQGLTANLITAFLVIVASRFGMPVSTTHVSCGSLFGIGAATGRGHWKTIGTILLSWVTTLPLAAALGAACYFALGSLDLA